MYRPNIELIADSVFNGERLSTLVVWNAPKQLLQELNTHRSFIARNAASSRAIPVRRVIQSVIEAPFIPPFTGNQRGMVGAVLDDPEVVERATRNYLEGRDRAVEIAMRMVEDNIHKQDVNILLEPFMLVPWIVSSMNWKNFFALRCSPHAKPAFQMIANGIKSTLEQSAPVEKQSGEWHIPFYGSGTDVHGKHWNDLGLMGQIQVCIARIARISVNNFDGKVDYQDDMRLYSDLRRDGHLSPFEHVCKACYTDGYQRMGDGSDYEPYQYGSFWDLKAMRGNWVQFRHL